MLLLSVVVVAPDGVSVAGVHQTPAICRSDGSHSSPPEPFGAFNFWFHLKLWFVYNSLPFPYTYILPFPFFNLLTLPLPPLVLASSSWICSSSNFLPNSTELDDAFLPSSLAICLLFNRRCFLKNTANGGMMARKAIVCNFDSRSSEVRSDQGKNEDGFDRRQGKLVWYTAELMNNRGVDPISQIAGIYWYATRVRSPPPLL